MSLLTDIKNVSDSAIEQLAARFGDLPKPLLAAIGAGDLAVERLAKLREQVGEKFGETFGTAEGMPSREDIKEFASDLPGKAQKVAGDVARHLEQFASDAPGRAQQLISELPAKAQEFSNSLSADNLKSTIEAYTQMVAQIYGNLADRGGETVTKARAEHAGDAAATSDGAASKESGSGDDVAASKSAAAKSTPAPKAAPKPAAKRPAARKPAAKKDEPKKDDTL